MKAPAPAAGSWRVEPAAVTLLGPQVEEVLLATVIELRG